MRTTVLVASVLFAASLAACGKKGEPAGEGQTAVSQLDEAPATAAATPPKRQPGLWRQTMSVEGQPTMVSRICTDAAFEQKATVFANNAMPGACAESSATPAAGGWSFHSVCDMGTGGKTVTDGTASGDFATRYEVKATTTTSGAAAPQMNRTSQMTILAEWQGACPADWAAGDMELPGGMRVNGAAMMKAAAAAPSK
jgi:hypothetical protein